MEKHTLIFDIYIYIYLLQLGKKGLQEEYLLIGFKETSSFFFYLTY